MRPSSSRSNQAAVVLALAIILALACILFPNTTLAQDEKLYNLYTKARTAQQAGDFQTAVGHYEELVRLRPDLAEAHANLGSGPLGARGNNGWPWQR